MGEITDQNQPVSHRLSLAYASCIRAGQRAAAGKTASARGRAGDPSRVRAGVVARPAGARGGAAFLALFTGGAEACSPHSSGGFPGPRPWPC
jgi:hypothetical protein